MCDNINKEIYKSLASFIARDHYDDLCQKVSEMTFIQAYNKLKGYNLEMCTTFYGNELASISAMFSVTYGTITTTIFQLPDNTCEVHEEAAVTLKDEFGNVVAEYEMGEIEVF